ncbi:MAG: hypothetical protein WD773_03040 [Gemmatimonadales bacterium]
MRRRLVLGDSHTRHETPQRAGGDISDWLGVVFAGKEQPRSKGKIADRNVRSFAVADDVQAPIHRGELHQG